jgi:hypothetical protein
MANTYRSIWIKTYGKIPKDSLGRSYEIHHIDGNRQNNDISNLICISIEEHYNIHYKQNDFGACVMIARRMGLPADYISNIQRGVKRPGIGGVKKGTIPWNKNKSGYSLNLTEQGKLRKLQANKKSSIISDNVAEQIRTDLKNNVFIDNPDIGKVKRNGKVFSYERAFCLEYSKKYNVSITYIVSIVKGKAKIV